MSEKVSAAFVVASIKPCDQYRYRVELPPELDRKVRVDIRHHALEETNDLFLDCTRRYQEIAWAGDANLSFADSRHSPSDSKSEFFHGLICLKIVELSCLHHRGSNPAGDSPELAVAVDVLLPQSARRALERLGDSLGLKLIDRQPSLRGPLVKPLIGGIYRASRQVDPVFALQPIQHLESLRGAISRRLAPLPVLNRCVNILMRGYILLFWPIPLLARFVFGFYYRAAVTRVLKNLDCSRNVFVYFDLRLGRNRDVGSYLRWKYGDAFKPGGDDGSSFIPFSHLARSAHAYSMGAMVWSYQALRRMEKQPMDGCVVVNYMMPAMSLVEIRLLRNGHRRAVRRQLEEFQRQSTGFFENLIYAEFIASLGQSNAFPIEVSACYRRFFESLTPGVVVQADAVAKTARHFTSCARRLGSRVIYVADRICTSLRTSNQLIADGNSGNPHFPDRFVGFDRITRDEFLRQGVAPGHVYSYCRNFSAAHGGAIQAAGPGRLQVVVLLQAYEDNIGGMVRLGEEIVGAMSGLDVVYQEHPNFPVCDRMKAGILKEWPGRVRFLGRGEQVDFATSLALVTGYSTAAVPGVLAGLPLIWLRRQIDNSIYGEAYLNRIGFVADRTDEVITLLESLLRRDPAMIEGCVAATTEAKAIFTPVRGGVEHGFSAAIQQAINDSFDEITPLPPALRSGRLDSGSLA